MTRKACQQRQTVIAIGGGAIVDPQNCELLAKDGLIVCLEAKPETIYERLFQEAVYSPETEVLSVSEVAEEVIRAWRLLRRPDFIGVPRNDKEKAQSGIAKDIACLVETATQSYPVFVGYGLLDKLGEKMRQAALSGTATIISDKNVFSLYGSKVVGILKDAGFVVNSFVVPRCYHRPGRGHGRRLSGVCCCHLLTGYVLDTGADQLDSHGGCQHRG